VSQPEKPRVALFTYGTQPRGGVVHTLELAEALHARGTPVVVFGIDESGTGFFRTPRCRHVLVPIERRSESTPSFVRRRIDAYVRAIERSDERFDIYHAQDGISANALATLAERGRIERFVRTVHHVDTFAEPELEALQHRSIRSAAKTFVVSRLWQTFLAERFAIMADVVPNGVDLARFVPISVAERSALRSELGYGTGPLFLSIGGVEQRKNSIALLDAFAIVRRERPDAVLAIAGGASVFDHGAYRAAFAERSNARGLTIGRDVRILGPLPDSGIVRHLQAANVLTFPSLVEGFGLAVLEALACETPVIASRIAPFTEYLGRDDALLVDPNDPTAIARAMTSALDPVVAATLAEHGRRVARSFTWDASAAAHLAAYRTFLGSERGLAHA